MDTYNLTINEKQAQVIAQALDLASRIQMGQWCEFIEWLPPQNRFCVNDLREQLQPIMDKHFAEAKPIPIRGWGSHYSIHSPYVHDTARVAWDLQKVIEHRLAWDRNPSGGITVDFDGPHCVGSEPQAVMEKVNRDQVAAAPELLEALQNVLRWMPVYPKEADDIVGGRASYEKAIADAVAALDKALGDTVPPCKCNFKQKTAGDGCAICNPERAADYATDKTNETEGEA